MKANAKHSFSETFSAFLLAFLFFMLFTSAVSFFLYRPINNVILPLSLFLSTGLVYVFFDRGRVLCLVVLSSILFIVCSGVLCSLIHDSTFDSYSYHYDAVVMMVKGWNPLHELPWNDCAWNRHYAKGLEIMQAAVLGFTGNLQSTKCVNFILVLSAASLTWYAIGAVFPSVSFRWKVALVFMTIANPVVICQLTTAYNDYMLWPETVLLTCCFLMIWKSSGSITTYILLMMTLAIGINSKFTHLYYLGADCVFFAVWCVIAKKYNIILPGLMTALSALFVGVVIIGFNPYVLNTFGYGNPFYPLVGGDVDIMTGNTPLMFRGSTRFTNFFVSLFSIGDTPWAFFSGKPTFQEILQSYTMDSRINGFGIMMGPMLIAGVILMICNRASLRWWIVYLFFLMMCFSFEQSWWARYIPFMWALVVIPILNFAIHDNSQRAFNRIKTVVASLIILLAIVNASFAVTVSLMARYSYTSYINYITKVQKESLKPIRVANMNYTFRQIFDEREINYKEYPYEKLIEDSSHLFLIYGLKNKIVAELPKEDYPELYAEPKGVLDKIINYPKRRLNLPTTKDETR